MDKFSSDAEASIKDQQTGSISEFLKDLYTPNLERSAAQSKSPSDSSLQGKEEFDAATSKKLEQMASDVADVIAKNGTFGATFKERDYVVGSALRNSFDSLHLSQSGVKELAERINANLAKKGSDFRVDLDMASDGLDHRENWNDRYRNIDMYIVKKEDFDKRDKRFDFLDNDYKDKAVDRVQLHGAESHEFSKDYDNYWRLRDGIIEKGNFSGDCAYGRSSVKEALQDALTHFGPEGVKRLVAQLNEDLKQKGCGYHIDFGTREKITSEPGLGHSGLGILNVDLKIVDNNSKKEKDSLTLEQHFMWGAPLLPGTGDDWRLHKRD